MANATIVRKYYFVKYSEMNTIPLREGNVIAISDGSGWYYDIGTPPGSGNNIERINVSANYVYVQTLPDSGGVNTIYILDTGRTLVGTNTSYFELYVWENEDWQCIANNSSDVNVTSLVTSAQYYLTGSEVSTGTTGTLVKRADVFVTDAGKISAKGFIGGPADNATNAVNAQISQIANVAHKDDSGNNIDSYIKSISPNSSNANVTITKGDGTTSSITTYVPPVMNASQAGLVPQIPQNTALNVLYRDGWRALDVSELTADSAVNDSNGQEIVTTYIKGLSFNDSTRKLTYTKGNDTTSDITIPDTTYTDYSGPGNGHGLVPASATGDANRYFRVDGSWSTLPNLSGASASSAGSAGVVPAPQTTDVNSYLKGDGTWSALPEFNGTVSGIVPVPTSSNKYLFSDGTWVDLPEMQGATSTSDGVSGIVPTPTDTDYDKFLCGDGTWSNVSIPVFAPNVNGLVPAPGTVVSDSYLASSGVWRPLILNTTGTSDIGNTSVQLSDIFTGDGTTVAFTLSYIPEGSITVTVDNVPTTEYTQSNDVITFNTAPATDANIVITYMIALNSARLYITASPTQATYSQTYTNSGIYVQSGKLYSDNSAVVTEDAVFDTSFTPSANLSVISNRCGKMYYITVDGTANSAINVGDAIATTTNTFIKIYAVGKVGNAFATFKLEGNSITCDTAISANDAISVSFNALV